MRIHTPKPPGPVIGAAVLLFFYGGALLFCGVCSGLGLTVDDPDNPFAIDEEMVREIPSYLAVEATSAVGNILTGAVMLLTATGLLRLMPIARIAAYVVATAEIFQSLAHAAYTAIVVMPVQERIFAGEMQNLPPFLDFLGSAFWGFILFGVIYTLAFCLPVIFLLSGPQARSAFTSDYFEPASGVRRSRRADYDEEDDEDSRSKWPRRPGPDTGYTDRS